MLILIDHANVDAIAKTLEYLPIDGVTTNPTILYREGKEPLEVLHAIKSVLPDGGGVWVFRTVCFERVVLSSPGCLWPGRMDDHEEVLEAHA